MIVLIPWKPVVFILLLLSAILWCGYVGSSLMGGRIHSRRTRFRYSMTAIESLGALPIIGGERAAPKRCYHKRLQAEGQFRLKDAATCSRHFRSISR